MSEDEVYNTLNGASARKVAAIEELGEVLGQEVTLPPLKLVPPNQVVEKDETELVEASANGSFFLRIKRFIKGG